MNTLLTILGIIAGLIVLLLIIALFTKKSYAIKREVIIRKPSQEAFDYIRHLKNQDHYSVWVMMDPHLKKSFKGTDGQIGFIFEWDGNKQAGAGEQEITNIVEGKSMDVELRFKRPFSGLANTQFTTAPVAEGQTKVTWDMRSKMKYPMNIMLLFMDMDKMLGKDLQKSLDTLKGVLEAS